MAEKTVVYIERGVDDRALEREIFAEAGAVLEAGECKTEDDVIELAKDADALVASNFRPVSDKIMAALPRLKQIVRGGIGVDTIDIRAATKHGIIITNVPHYCLHEVSDLAITMMLALMYKLPIMMNSTGRGDWDPMIMRPLRSLWKQTVGIVALGNIGRHSAIKAASHGMRVIFYDPMIKEDQPIGEWTAHRVELDELLRESDAILLHAPANPSTHHMINRESLRKVKRGCILVNTARAVLVDVDAMVDALRDGTLGGAGLDLIEGVPPLGAEHPLLAFENVIITPYTAWYTEDSMLTQRKSMATDIARVLKGYYPKAFINPDVKPNARAGQLKDE